MYIKRMNQMIKFDSFSAWIIIAVTKAVIRKSPEILIFFILWFFSIFIFMKKYKIMNFIH